MIKSAKSACFCCGGRLGFLWGCLGFAVGVFGFCCGAVLVLLWGCLGFSVGVVWVFCGGVLVFLWGCLGFSVGVAWVCCGGVLVFLWGSLGFSVRVSWFFCGGGGGRAPLVHRLFPHIRTPRKQHHPHARQPSSQKYATPQCSTFLAEWLTSHRYDGVAFVGWVEGQEMKITLVARPHPSTTMSIQQATQATAGNGH